MSNVGIKNIFNEIHNVFWKKWRDSVPIRDSGDWEVIIQEGKDLMKKYNHCPLVVCNVRELIGELSNRMEGCEKMPVKKKVIPQEEIYLCYICGKEIHGDHVRITTRRRRERHIHFECMKNP